MKRILEALAALFLVETPTPEEGWTIFSHVDFPATAKPLKGATRRKVFEAKLDKGMRILWELRRGSVVVVWFVVAHDAISWEGKGGFNVTSTCKFSDEMCQRKCPLFENSTSDDLSSKNESKRVKTDRDTSLER